PRLVVRGQRAVLHAEREEDPRLAPRLEHEGRVPGVALEPRGLGVARVVRPLLGVEVRLVAEPGPAALAFIPPDVLLAFGPRLALRVRGAAVVEHADVVGPGPPPRACDPAVALLAPPRQVAAWAHAAVDPAAARGRAVVLQLAVALELLALLPRGRPVIAADLAQHGLDIGLALRPGRRVVPQQRLDRPVPLLLRVRVQLLDAPAQVHHEPRIGARVARRVHGAVVPLDQPLRVRERAVLLRHGRGGEQEDL